MIQLPTTALDIYPYYLIGVIFFSLAGAIYCICKLKKNCGNGKDCD
jgi:hypothetical protein